MIEPIKIEVTGVTDKEAFCKLLSKEFDIPVVYEKKGKAMTTNFIWLLENDAEKLADMIVGSVHLMELESGYERCQSCFMNKNNYCGEEDRHQDMECSEIFEEWLKAKYVEPDSYEKIEYDAMGLSQTLNELYSCPVDITNEVVNLVLRCEKLAGVE